MLLKFELKPLFLYYLMSDEFEISSGRLLLLKNALDDYREGAEKLHEIERNVDCIRYFLQN